MRIWRRIILEKKWIGCGFRSGSAPSRSGDRSESMLGAECSDIVFRIQEGIFVPEHINAREVLYALEDLYLCRPWLICQLSAILSMDEVCGPVGNFFAGLAALAERVECMTQIVYRDLSHFIRLSFVPMYWPSASNW